MILAVGAGAFLFWDLKLCTPLLERRVAAVADRARVGVDPHELQTWAVSVLAQSPRPAGSDLEKATIPQALHRLYKDRWKWGPHVSISDVDEDSNESYLLVYWGGGFGHWGFLVGSPNFKTSDPFYYLVEWISGVYFFADKA